MKQKVQRVISAFIQTTLYLQIGLAAAAHADWSVERDLSAKVRLDLRQSFEKVVSTHWKKRPLMNKSGWAESQLSQEFNQNSTWIQAADDLQIGVNELIAKVQFLRLIRETPNSGSPENGQLYLHAKIRFTELPRWKMSITSIGGRDAILNPGVTEMVEFLLPLEKKGNQWNPNFDHMTVSPNDPTTIGRSVLLNKISARNSRSQVVRVNVERIFERILPFLDDLSDDDTISENDENLSGFIFTETDSDWNSEGNLKNRPN